MLVWWYCDLWLVGFGWVFSVFGDEIVFIVLMLHVYDSGVGMCGVMLLFGVVVVLIVLLVFWVGCFVDCVDLWVLMVVSAFG